MAEKINIEEVYKKELLWSEPIVYKEITLYPIKCKDLVEFYSSVQALLYDPLRYPGRVSTLPRLYFLTDFMNHRDDKQYIQQNMMLYMLFVQLNILLGLVIGEQKCVFMNNNNHWYLQFTNLDGKEINVKINDFEEIRKIILHQNGVDFDDTFIHEDIRRWIAKQEEKENKTPATLEDYLDAFTLATQMTDMEKIKEIPIRRFNRIVEKTISRESYTIQMTASMSGFVTFKGEISHWLHTEKKNSIFEKYFKEMKS